MELTPSSVDRIFECRDLCEAITTAYYLIESIKDAMSNRWGEDGLIDHVSFLLGEYEDKMEKLLPALNETLDNAYNLAKNESVKIEKSRLDEVYQTNTVG